MNTETNIRDFKTKGFVAVLYPQVLRDMVRGVVPLWQNFCKLPQDFKSRFPYLNESGGFGYEYKDGSGEKGDRKENFDVGTAGFKWLISQAEKVNNEQVLEFVRSTVSLVSWVKPFALDFAYSIEEEFGLTGYANEVMNDDAFFVRFIHYFPATGVDEETANPHTDKTGFTLHLFENEPGLQCLNFDGMWNPMPVSVNQTVIIPGMQTQLRSVGNLKALCHRVVANEVTMREGRLSAVCFVRLGKTPHYNKDTYGRLQGMDPGWNYVVSSEEFQKYFAK